MDLIGIILVIVFAIISNAAKKNKKKSETAKQQLAQSAARRPGAPAAQAKPAVQKAQPKNPTAYAKKPAAPAKAQPKPAAPTVKPTRGAFEEDYEGSIKMPEREPHTHEGKELPCPADEREAKRARPSAHAPAAPAQPATAPIAFNKNALVQAVVMSEILSRPRFENGRRVIR